MTALRHHGARKLSALDFTLQVFSAVACLLLALWWRNVWAMIAAMIAQSALRLILSYTWFPDSKHVFTRDAIISREFVRFSRLIIATSVITLIITQTDKLVLAKLFTLEEFGLYAIALSLALAPTSVGDAYITRVIFPVYAQLWRTAPSALAGVYYSVRRTVSLLFALGCGGIIGGAHLLVTILYDPRYADAAVWLSLLMIGVALRLPNVAASQFMTAKGDIKSTLHVSIVRLIWLLAAIPLGYLRFGPLGVVGAVGLVEIPAMLFSWSVLRRAGVLNMREELSFLVVVALGALASSAISTELTSIFSL
jgi:O-antigen/teichoic acid export membrane protein